MQFKTEKPGGVLAFTLPSTWARPSLSLQGMTHNQIVSGPGNMGSGLDQIET